MSGSLGLLGGLPFASPYIGKGSFAVVKVAEEENVDIYQSNRKISKTNRHGLALVTNLAPYEKNIISINAEDLAFDLEINETSQVLAPYARSGSFINFDIKKTNNRLVRLQTSDGIAILAGTKVRVLPGNNNFVVAKRGEVYLKDLASENSILVPLPNGNCTATVSAPPSSKDKGLSIIAVCF
jgi:outer membrane usher protein